MRRPPQSRKADGAHVDTVSILALCRNLHNSEVLTQANEAPSARGRGVQGEAGICIIVKFSATLRGKAGSSICWIFGADERSAESAGGYVQGMAGSINT